MHPHLCVNIPHSNLHGNVSEPSMDIWFVTHLHCTNLVMQCLENSGCLKVIPLLTACDGRDWRDDDCCSHGTNLLEVHHLCFKVDRSPLHGESEIPSQVLQAFVGDGLEYRVRIRGDVDIVLSNGHEVRSVKLFDVPVMLGIQVEANGKSGFFTLLGRQNVCCVISSTLHLSNTHWCSTIVVIHDPAWDGRQSLGFVVGAYRGHDDNEGKLTAWA
mmetsp:Transcript_14445/g.25406  ORF Transcript_14445/g.25406 Transcript_14445/m.25406 type:complete len:215 (+) Transcript_14445:227-871(+)